MTSGPADRRGPLREGPPPATEELQAWIRVVYGLRRPRHHSFTDELPRTHTGKLLRREVLAWVAGDSGDGQDVVSR